MLGVSVRVGSCWKSVCAWMVDAAWTMARQLHVADILAGNIDFLPPQHGRQ